jgi:hypothetical protein
MSLWQSQNGSGLKMQSSSRTAGFDTSLVADLLELHQCGAKVAWPVGLDPLAAEQLLLARGTGDPATVAVIPAAGEPALSARSTEE